MAFMQQKFIFSALVSILCFAIKVSSRSRVYTPPNVTPLTSSFPRVPIARGFTKTFGASNIQYLFNGSMATLALNKTSG